METLRHWYFVEFCGHEIKFKTLQQCFQPQSLISCWDPAVYDGPEQRLTQFFTYLCENLNISIRFQSAPAARWQSPPVLPGQLFPPLVAVVRPDKDDSSRRGGERGGIYGLNPNPPNPLQRSATGASVSTGDIQQNNLHLTHKYTNIQTSLLLINHTLPVLYVFIHAEQ